MRPAPSVPGSQPLESEYICEYIHMYIHILFLWKTLIDVYPSTKPKKKKFGRDALVELPVNTIKQT